MSTFYSILYVPIRPALDEKVSIGLFLRHQGQVYFKYSLPKLNIIKMLIPGGAFSLARAFLKNMEASFNESDDPSGLNDLLNVTETSRYFDEGYFEYLSRYSNNVVSFSKPKRIDITFSETLFDRLFEKYVFELESEKLVEKSISAFQRVKRNLYPRIVDRVNVDQHLTAKQIPNLFVPTDVHFIGKNDVPVAGHTFEFEKRLYNLEHDVASFVGLAKAFELNGEKHGKFYVIGKEPSRRDFPDQHNSWKTIHESKFLEFVPLNELDRIDDYMKDHEVEPFFSTESTPAE